MKKALRKTLKALIRLKHKSSIVLGNYQICVLSKTNDFILDLGSTSTPKPHNKRFCALQLKVQAIQPQFKSQNYVTLLL